MRNAPRMPLEESVRMSFLALLVSSELFVELEVAVALGFVVSTELFVELEVAVALVFFVEVGSGRGACRPCQEGDDLARKRR